MVPPAVNETAVTTGVSPDPSVPGTPIKIRITRQPYDDYFVLHFSRRGKDQSEELEPDDARKWFKDHGVKNSEAVERALDDAWNFYESIVNISATTWKEPVLPNQAYLPNI